MAARTLRSAPRILPLYVRAAAPMLPGASLLPGVPGGGGEIPDTELELPGVRVDAARLADYAHVCGFTLRDELPPAYPHVLAFPLHMALMADARFPFGAVGLVHVANRITQRRPIGVTEPLDLRVRATPLQDHPKGRTFSIVSEARVGDELVWEGESTMLRRGGGSRAGGREKRGRGAEPPGHAVWKLPGDLGRRYGAVSGDRNPIHMHSLAAKAFGFPRAIAHGMWTKARCLAALEDELPRAFTAEVEFRRPILLPGTVAFGEAPQGAGIRFAVRDAKQGTPHLDGRVTGVTRRRRPAG
jgi:acyl dehydratase